MDTTTLIPFAGGTASHQGGKREKRVYFMRRELNSILNTYGRMVAAGVWLDYSIDHLPKEAIFSVFRRTSESPRYRIIKDPALHTKQGMWRIVAMDGQVVKRGKDLKTLLRYFDPMLLKALNKQEL